MFLSAESVISLPADVYLISESVITASADFKL